MGKKSSPPPPVVEWENGFPAVYATVEQYRGANLLYFTCPYCGERHQHGGGSTAEDPRENAGHRLSHCVRARTHDRGYIIRVSDKWREHLPLSTSQRKP